MSQPNNNDLNQNVPKSEVAPLHQQELFAHISHEFKTPIHAILNTLKLLKSSNLSNEQSDLTSIAIDNATHLATLIEDVLTLSKADSGKMTLNLIPFDLNHDIKTITNMVTHDIQSKGLSFIVHHPHPLPNPLIGDPSKLRQIIINLISNALKFTSVGSITLDISHTTISNSQINLCVKVIDTGKGIHADKLTTILEPFEQEDASISQTYGGTGLGLSICNKLIHLMGGTLKLTSQPNHGTTAEFTIPLTKSIINPIKTPTEDASPTFSKQLKILICDDNKINIAILNEYLKQLNCTTLYTQSAKTCLSLTQNERYDIILLDLRMPDIDGIELAKQIKLSTQNPNHATPIILTTADSLSDSFIHDYHPIFAATLIKPFDKNTLYKTISSCLDSI